jgi:hypothetical protein
VNDGKQTKCRLSGWNVLSSDKNAIETRGGAESYNMVTHMLFPICYVRFGVSATLIVRGEV